MSRSLCGKPGESWQVAGSPSQDQPHVSLQYTARCCRQAQLDLHRSFSMNTSQAVFQHISTLGHSKKDNIVRPTGVNKEAACSWRHLAWGFWLPPKGWWDLCPSVPGTFHSSDLKTQNHRCLFGPALQHSYANTEVQVSTLTPPWVSLPA